MKLEDHLIGRVSGEVVKEATKVVGEVEHVVVPLQKSIFKRFPTVFLLSVTFGFTATAFAMEQIISSISVLNENPVLLLALGIGILFATGTVYKKLG